MYTFCNRNLKNMQHILLKLKLILYITYEDVYKIRAGERRF